MAELEPVLRAALELLDGCVDPPEGGVGAAQLTKWLVRNKVALKCLPSPAPGWLADDETFRETLAAEEDWYQTQRDEYALVRQAWLERGIPCLMIKSAGNAPSFPHTSDNIDIAVPPERGAEARETLRQLGYVELRNIEEPHKFLFRKWHAGRCVSAIHVHEQVIWFVGFMDEPALWARRRVSDDDPLVTVPSPEDAVLINLAHLCYENKLLRLNDLLRIRFALASRRGALDWAYMERVAEQRGWLDGLALLLLICDHLERELYGASQLPASQRQRCEELLAGDPPLLRRLAEIRAQPRLDLPLDLSYWFCKRLYYRKILADRQRSLAERWADVGRTLIWGIRLKSRVRPQPRLLVSLSGVDGSGKTAHARALVDALRLAEIRTDYWWSRGGSTGLLGLVSRVRKGLQREPREAAGADTITRRRGRLRDPRARLAWSWLVALDQIATFTLQARLSAARGHVAVFDRYVYDTAVEMQASLPPEATWSRRAVEVMLRLAPRPHLSYLLDVTAETARARKSDEVWHADFERERADYLALAERRGLRVRSNDQEFAELNDALIREVMMAFMVDYETWLNALFLANPSQKNPPDLVWARSSSAS